MWYQISVILEHVAYCKIIIAMFPTVFVTEQHFIAV